VNPARGEVGEPAESEALQRTAHDDQRGGRPAGSLIAGAVLVPLIAVSVALLVVFPGASPSREVVRTLTGHTKDVNAVAVTPDGRQIVSGSDDGTVRVWDLATGEAARTLTNYGAPVAAVAVTPDGRQIVSGSDDDTVRMWDLPTRPD